MSTLKKIRKSKWTYTALWAIVFGALLFMANTYTHIGYGFAAFFWFLFSPVIITGLHDYMKVDCHHVAESDYYGGTPYGRVERTQIDGIGRMHAHIYVRCRKCDQYFPYAKIHVSSDEKVDKLYGICYRTNK